ncbi:MAG: hypothetical protein Q9179_004029 [Wetmoreana sp. 5 TL-2023]
MDSTRRLEAIKEGKFLSLHSDVSVNSSAGLYSTRERPFVIPVHDPQGSIATSRYSKELASTGYAPSESSYSTSEKDSGVETKPEAKKASGSNRHSRVPSLRIYGDKAGIKFLENESSNPPPYVSPPPRPPRPTTLQRPITIRASRFSITPSLIGTGYAAPDLSNRRKSHLGTITSDQPRVISPMHVVKLPEEWNPDLEPQDGGTLAWMQVLAGFFVIMDAQ